MPKSFFKATQTWFLCHSFWVSTSRLLLVAGGRYRLLHKLVIGLAVLDGWRDFPEQQYMAIPWPDRCVSKYIFKDVVVNEAYIIWKADADHSNVHSGKRWENKTTPASAHPPSSSHAHTFTPFHFSWSQAPISNFAGSRPKRLNQ